MHSCSRPPIYTCFTLHYACAKKLHHHVVHEVYKRTSAILFSLFLHHLVKVACEDAGKLSLSHTKHTPIDTLKTFACPSSDLNSLRWSFFGTVGQRPTSPQPGGREAKAQAKEACSESKQLLYGCQMPRYVDRR